MSGVGSELKNILAVFGTYEVTGCKCRDRAAKMDRNGIEWCEANVPTIVGWLKEEASKRKLPFLEIVARCAISRAIRNARKAI